MMRTVAVAVAAAFIVAAGCSSDDSARTTADPAGQTTEAGDPSVPPGDETSSSEQSSGELDVCAMLSADDVAEVLGESATPTDQSTGDLYGCSWEGESDALNVLSVSVYVHPDADTARAMYDATKEGLEGVDILGLGDEASYTEMAGLEVLFGRYDISVDNTGPTEKESDLTIAKKVISLLA